MLRLSVRENRPREPRPSWARRLLCALLLASGCGVTEAAEPGAEIESQQVAQAVPDADAPSGTPEGVDVGTLRFGPAPVGTRAEDPLAGFPTGERQRRILCARPGSDEVRAVFCKEERPAITSLVDLQRALDLDFRSNAAAVDETFPDAPRALIVPGPEVYAGGPYPPAGSTSPYPVSNGSSSGPYPAGGGSTSTGGTAGRANPQFALTAHSTSLVSRLTSAINPRAVIFRQNLMRFVAMGYVRGEQFVELAARSDSGGIAFFLVRYRQACNDTHEGCGPGDLYTLETEKNWTSYDVYAAEDVRNNVMDCAQCHQPAGPGTPPLLRMQEQLTPWTHWMRSSTAGGSALLRDYHAAKGNETFAGIPGNLIGQSSPFNLQNLIATQGYGWLQPNEFLSTVIEEEVGDSAPGQPDVNVPAGKSPTWNKLYEKNVQGLTIAVPYHDVKVTDPDKLASLTRAYAAYREGTLPRAQVPDLSQIFPSDRATLAEVGFAPKPGLDGEGLIRQLCTQCHNGKLDPTLSRARFDADLSKVSREERWLAAQRVMLPEHDLRSMPPRRFRTLTDDERSKIVEALSR